MNKRFATLGYVTLISTLIACGNVSRIGTFATAPQVRVTSTPPTISSVVLPDNFDAYPAGSLIDRVLLSGNTFTQIEQQVQEAIRECMSRAGFTTTAIPISIEPADDLSRNLADVAISRAVIGYGVTASESSTQTANGGSLTEPFREALGNESFGCTREAQQKIYPNFPFYQQQFGWVSAAFDEALSADASLSAAWNEWSACMHERGYEVGHSNEAKALVEGAIRDARRTGGSLKSVLSFEIAVATSDTACYRKFVQPVKVAVETHLLDSWTAAKRLPNTMWPLSPTSP